MKSFIKVALAGAALAASGGAFADVALPNSGNGQAVLFVKNELTGDVYARGLNLFANDVVTEAAVVADTYTGVPGSPDTSLSFALPGTIGPDQNLTNFLAASGAKTWTVMFGDSLGGIAAGQKRAFTTAQVVNASPSNSIINTPMTSQLQQFMVSVNAVLPDSGDNSVVTGGHWDQAGNSIDEGADVWFGANINNKNDLGTASNFYLVTSSGTGTSGAGRFYLLGQLQLNADGSLQSVGGTTTPVPLPAAAWLLGSALVGFAGVARRRREAAAA